MSLVARQGIIARKRTTTPVVPNDPDEAIFMPVSYGSLAAARTALNAPSDANYVMWNHDGQGLEQVFASLGNNDILVLPERAEPYPIDSSNGFMAAGASAITGPNGTRTPIVSNNRLWFAMCRARRGVIGLGPGAIIEPTNSGWTAPPQPKPMYWFNTAGEQQSELIGAQCVLMEVDNPNPFFANFTIKGRDFGGVAYNGMSLPANNNGVIKRIHFNQSWRGFESVPNGETGAIKFLRNYYTIENCLFTPHPTLGPSPIMWNITSGGVMRNVKVKKHTIGMITFWRCLGLNTFENVYTDSNKTALNLEEEEAGFELNWTGGEILIDGSLNGWHLNINPSGGSQKIHLSNVTASLNGYVPGKLCAQVYTTSNTQKRSDVTWDGGEVGYIPASRWID